MTAPPAARPRGTDATPAAPAGRARPGPLSTRWRWWRSSGRRRRDLERPASDPWYLGRHRLPGTSADTELHEARDAYDRPFGLVLVPRTGHASALLALRPAPADLLDAAVAERWMTHLRGWLAQLARDPDLTGCTVGVRAVPAGGPCGSAGGRPGVAVTLQPTWRTRGPQGRTDPAALAAELGGRLPRLVHALDRLGVGTAVPVSGDGVVRGVAAAYDPGGGHGPGGPGDDPGTAAGQVWAEVAPAAVEELWDRIRHDGATSLTWCLGDVPAAVAISGVLAPVIEALSAPDRPGPWPARLALVHRPPRPPARQAAEPVGWTGLTAAATAPEPWFGGGAAPQPGPHLTALISVTVAGHRPGERGAAGTRRLPQGSPDGASEDAVRAVLTGVAPALRPWLRPLYGSQAGALAAVVPTGTLLGVHTAAPAAVLAVEP